MYTIHMQTQASIPSFRSDRSRAKSNLRVRLGKGSSSHNTFKLSNCLRKLRHKLRINKGSRRCLLVIETCTHHLLYFGVIFLATLDFYNILLNFDKALNDQLLKKVCVVLSLCCFCQLRTTFLLEHLPTHNNNPDY